MELLGRARGASSRRLAASGGVEDVRFEYRLMAGSVVLGLGALPAGAQEWVFDVPGVIAEPPDVYESILKLLYHPAGELIAIGGRQTTGAEVHGVVMRVGLDAQLKGVSQYISPTGLNHTFHAGVLGPDDVVVCAGYFTEAVTTPFLFALQRETGAVVWEQTTTFESGGIHSIARGPDGYVASGTMNQIEPGSSFDGYLVRVDFDGEVLWQKRYDQFGSHDSWRDVFVRGDGSIQAGATSNHTPMVIDLAADGTVLQARRYELAGGQSLTRIQPTPDGGLFLASTSLHEVFGNRTVWIGRMDAGGDLVWQNEYRTKVGTTFEFIVTADGGCALVASAVGESSRVPGVLRVGPDGAILWNRGYPLHSSDAHPWQVEIAELPDGDLALCVDSYDIPASDHHTMFYRIAPDGSLASGCIGYGEELLVSAQPTDVMVTSVPMLTSPVDVAVPELTVEPAHMAMQSSLLCGEPSPPPSTYCDTTPNSVGPGAHMGWSGSTSVAANDGVATASGLPPGAVGVFIRSISQGSAPLGEGQLCVAQPVHRVAIAYANGAGHSQAAVQLEGVTPPGTEVLPGSEWLFQLWYRDPIGGPAGSNLSDGLRVQYLP